VPKVLGKVTLRAKVLIGVAVACAGYIVLMPDASQTIEPTHGANKPSSAAAVRGATASAATAPGATAAARAIHPATASKSSLIKARLSATDRVAKDSAAADLFASHSWYVAPPPPPPAPVVYTPPPPPTAPPLPFAFMGSFRTDSGSAIYYLTAGDRVYDVKVGDTLDNTYSVDGVKSGQLLLTYMPLKIQQSLAVGDQ
jgi:hypothetical protein